MTLLLSMILDSFDWITFLLLSATIISCLKTIRNYTYPVFVCLFCSIALYHALPVWSMQYLFISLPSMASSFITGFVFFILLFGVRVWTFIPVQSTNSLPLFALLSVGWIVLRSVFWVFIYIQGTLDSPYIRFQIDGPVTASLKAETWNFSRLQHVIDTVVTEKSKSIQTETDYSDKEIELLVDGLGQAERFRESLLMQTSSGKTQAQVIAQAIVRFHESANPVLQDHVTLDDFFLEEQELVDFINGNAGKIFGNLSFEMFNGKWYGLWDQNKVDHDWGDTQEFQPSLILDTQPLLGLQALQYAWIGDGFGWNAVVAPNNRNTGDVILGTVYHVRDQNPDDIYLHRPHVGIPLDEGQLIWITKSEIFLEQAFPNDDKEQESYAITGFYYERKDSKLVNQGDGFQAVYTRNPDNRPGYYRFPIEVSIDL